MEEGGFIKLIEIETNTAKIIGEVYVEYGLSKIIFRVNERKDLVFFYNEFHSYGTPENIKYIEDEINWKIKFVEILYTYEGFNFKFKINDPTDDID